VRIEDVLNLFLLQNKKWIEELYKIGCLSMTIKTYIILLHLERQKFAKKNIFVETLFMWKHCLYGNLVYVV
jgi:hypothetical protein